MRIVPVLGLVAALAACQSAPGGGGGAPAVQRAAPTARYVSEGVIEVSAVDPQAISDGRGLPGIKRRAQELGGKLTLDSAPGRGTQLIVELPPR